MNTAASASGATAVLPSSRSTILVVDDDLPLRILLDCYLTAFGYCALLAADGEEALLLAREHPEISLVMLDVVMCGLSGQELAELLKPLLPHAPILFCSGHSAPTLARLGIKIDAAQFMQKPCRPLELKQRLSEMLAARSAQR